MVPTAPRPGPRQMALDLALPESLSRDDFLPAPCNAAALGLVEGWPDWPAKTVALIGPPGAGKSHLGSIWADIAGARRVAARDLAGIVPADALATGALLLEDAGHAPPKSRCSISSMPRARRTPSCSSPRGGAGLLGRRPQGPRLAAEGLARFALEEPEDALLRAVLVKLFADRQLVVDGDIVEYLARRMERSLDAARRLVAELDREALEDGRRPDPAARAQVLDRVMQPNLF